MNQNEAPILSAIRRTIPHEPAGVFLRS
jgi:hypothetical protein